MNVHQYLYTYSLDGATSCGPRFESEAILTCGLITLTFDLSNSKWYHGSPVSWAGSFLPIFSLISPSILNLFRVGHGSRDRQTAVNA